MERDDLTFEQAQIAGAKRLEKFVRYVLGESVDVINTFDEHAPDNGNDLESLPSA